MNNSGISASLFLLGLISMDVVNSKVKDFDKDHWLILLPILFPLAGIYFGVTGLLNEAGTRKLIPLSILFINMCLAVVIFVTFAFSYWQF